MFLEVNSIRGYAEVSPQLASCSYAIGWNPFVMVVPRSTMEMSNFQIDQKIAMRALFLNALKLGQSGGSQQTCDIAAKIPSGRNPRAASAFISHSTLARGGAPVTAINRRPWFNSTIAAGHFFCNIWGNGGIIKDADRRDAYLKVAKMIMLSSAGWKSPGFPFLQSLVDWVPGCDHSISMRQTHLLGDHRGARNMDCILNRGWNFPGSPLFFQIKMRFIMDSWVKLYRKSIHGGWLRNQKLWTFWTYCLLKASHKIHKQIVGFQEVELQPGEFIFGLKQSSKELKMSVQSIRTCLQFLKKAGNLTIKTTNKYSIITIINWSTYQCNGYDINNQNNNPLTNHQQTTNKPLTTNKNDKKGNNDKNEENNIEAKIQTQKEWKPVIKFLVEEYFKTLTDRQKTRFEKDREKFHGCCDKLMRIDGFSEEEIRKAVNFARHDHFWSSNFLSFSKLRQKNKDGVPWIEVFISKSGAKKQSKPAVGDTPDLTPEEMEDYYKDDLDRSKL